MKWVGLLVTAWAVRRVFKALQNGDLAQWSRTRGPGIIPLPWAGPRGEVVLVELNERGRMVKPPVLCRTPKEMASAMMLTPPPMPVQPSLVS